MCSGKDIKKNLNFSKKLILRAIAQKTDFIITIPDVSHREDLEFPEWTKSDSSEFHRREEIISKSYIFTININQRTMTLMKP